MGAQASLQLRVPYHEASRLQRVLEEGYVRRPQPPQSLRRRQQTALARQTQRRLVPSDILQGDDDNGGRRQEILDPYPHGGIPVQVRSLHAADMVAGGGGRDRILLPSGELRRVLQVAAGEDLTTAGAESLQHGARARLDSEAGAVPSRRRPASQLLSQGAV